MPVKQINDTFREHFSAYGYSEIQAVPVSSRVDPTVRFIGSPISILKPIITAGNIPFPGIFAIQRCLRTHYMSSILNASFIPQRMSVFTQCVLYSIDNGIQLAAALMSLMAKYFKDKTGLLELHTWHKDHELHAIISNSNQYGIPVIPDHTSEDKYRHHYGNDSMHGRNFNVMFRDAYGGKLELANFILVDCENGQSGYEIAMGSNMVAQASLGVEHILDTTSTRHLNGSKATGDYVLRDSLLVCCSLLTENVQPSSIHAQNITLRTYLKSLCARTIMLGLEPSIRQIVTTVLINEYGYADENIISKIESFLNDYKSKLRTTDKLSNEDKKVVSLIKSHA